MSTIDGKRNEENPENDMDQRWREFSELLAAHQGQQDVTAQGATPPYPVSPERLEDQAMALMGAIDDEEQLVQLRPWALEGQRRVLRRFLGQEAPLPSAGPEGAIVGILDSDMADGLSCLTDFSSAQTLRRIFEFSRLWGMDAAEIDQLRQQVITIRQIDPLEVPELQEYSPEQNAFHLYNSQIAGWQRGETTAFQAIEVISDIDEDALLPSKDARFPEEMKTQAGQAFLDEVQGYSANEGKRVPGSFTTLLVHLIHLLPLGQDMFIQRALILLRTQWFSDAQHEALPNRLDEFIAVFARGAIQNGDRALAKEILDGITRVLPGFATSVTVAPELERGLSGPWWSELDRAVTLNTGQMRLLLVPTQEVGDQVREVLAETYGAASVVQRERINPVPKLFSSAAAPVAEAQLNHSFGVLSALLAQAGNLRDTQDGFASKYPEIPREEWVTAEGVLESGGGIVVASYSPELIQFLGNMQVRDLTGKGVGLFIVASEGENLHAFASTNAKSDFAIFIRFGDSQAGIPSETSCEVLS